MDGEIEKCFSDYFLRGCVQLYCTEKPICYTESMKFEQYQEPEKIPTDASEGRENFENSIEARNGLASLFLSGIESYNAENADIKKIVEAGVKTIEITPKEEIEKNTEKGTVRFTAYELPHWEDSGARSRTEISKLSIKETPEEGGKEKLYGASFIIQQTEGSDETDVHAKFRFHDSLYNPYGRENVINALEEPAKDRYIMLTSNLHGRLRALEALILLGRNLSPESYATRAQINEFVSILDREFRHQYNREGINEILEQ